MPENGTNTQEQLSEIIRLLRVLVERERPKPQRLLRVSEACQYLHVSAAQLRRLIQSGELEIIDLHEGSHSPWLVDRNSLDQLIERRKGVRQ